MAFQKVSRTIDADAELMLSSDYYLHRAIVQAIESPFKGLENGSFNESLVAVRLSGFLAEKFARSAGIVSLEEINTELKEYMELEKAKILEEYGLKETDEAAKPMLSYSKIAWILEKVEETKSTKTQYKVG